GEMIDNANVRTPVELGRQSKGEDALGCIQREAAGDRIVIAPLNDQDVSRQHALIEALAGDKLRLRNTSKLRSIRLTDGKEIAPGASCDLLLPAVLSMGNKTVRVEEPEEESSILGLDDAGTLDGSQGKSLAPITSGPISPDTAIPVKSVM